MKGKGKKLWSEGRFQNLDSLVTQGRGGLRIGVQSRMAGHGRSLGLSKRLEGSRSLPCWGLHKT